MVSWYIFDLFEGQYRSMIFQLQAITQNSPLHKLTPDLAQIAAPSIVFSKLTSRYLTGGDMDERCNEKSAWCKEQ